MLTLLVALGGCGQAVPRRSADAGQAARLSDLRDEVVPTAPPTAPAAPSTPAPTAGPLTGRHLPGGDALGEGWSPYTGTSDESGVLDNGAWTRKRDGAEVVAGMAPVGCPREAVEVTLPVPRWALEGIYRGPDQRPGVALALAFSDRVTAARFLGGLTAQVHACSAPAEASAPGPPVLTFTPLPSRPGTLTAWRRETGVDADPHRYLLVAEQVGRRVALVYVAGAEQQDGLRIAEALRVAASR